MTDPKPKPSEDNIERASRCVLRPVMFIVDWAYEFSASDAIARRRAIEECVAVLESRWGRNPPAGLYECTEMVRALLRAPTSEKAEETVLRCVKCGEQCEYIAPDGTWTCWQCRYCATSEETKP